MKYPTITRSRCTVLADQLRDRLTPPIEAYIVYLGVGDDVDLGAIGALVADLKSAMETWTDSDRDRLEGVYSVRVYEALRELPTEVLDDAGFWRYLALTHFWDFIAWREKKAFEAGNHHRYVDGQSSTESVVTRMFLRGAAVGGGEYADIAGGVLKGTDFWRSHVLRVRTGSAPPLTRALADKQRRDRLMTKAIREVARSLNRTWANIVLHLYDDEEATELIERLWGAVVSTEETDEEER